MGDELNPNDKLRMVLDYMPCAPCKEIPSDDQKYLCTICKRLNRTVARRCAYAAEIQETAPAPEPVPAIIIQGDKVFLTQEEWGKITSMLGSTPSSEEDKASGRVCISRKQWDEILDRIEQIWQPPQCGFEVQREEPEMKFSDDAGTSEEPQDWDDIEVVIGKPRLSQRYEPAPAIVAEEVAKDENWSEEKQNERKFVTGVKVFPAGPNVEEDIRKWAEEHGAVVKSKIPINIRQN